MDGTGKLMMAIIVTFGGVIILTTLFYRSQEKRAALPLGVAQGRAFQVPVVHTANEVEEIPIATEVVADEENNVETGMVAIVIDEDLD